jgi:hypothetical protein
MASQHIQNGCNGFWMPSSIHHLLECTPSCMFHIDQSWCTPYHHDLVSPTTLRSGAKGTGFLWWTDLTHDNQHTFKGSHPSSWQMEVVLLPQDRWCGRMVNTWARCLHFSFQTHPWILNIGKESYVDMAQHLVREEHKSKMHLLS